MVTRDTIRSTKTVAFKKLGVSRTFAASFTIYTLLNKSPVAAEALERIEALYAIEKEIRGRLPEERRQNPE
jgi:hypothetical protein